MINNQTNTQKPELTKLIFESGHKKTIAVYESRFEGEPCFCIEHRPSGAYSILDYDPNVINRVVEKIRADGLVCFHKRGRWKFRFGKNGVYLDRFVYMLYTQQMKESVGARIKILDTSLFRHGIVDLRSGNLFNGIGARTNSKRISVDILDGAHAETEHIRVRMNGGSLEEIYDYSPELYTLLTHTHYAVFFQGNGGRIKVRTGYKSCKKTMLLSRMVGLYYTFFGNFNGDLEAFGRAIPSLPGGDALEFDHVNSCKNIGCRENLIPVSKHLNEIKHELSKYFQLVNLDVFPIADSDGRILVEYHSRAGRILYRRCESPEAFLDWLQVSMGKTPLTQNLKIQVNDRGGYILWKDLFIKRKGTILEDMGFGEWYRRKEDILGRYAAAPDSFVPYQSGDYANPLAFQLELARMLDTEQIFFTGSRVG